MAAEIENEDRGQGFDGLFSSVTFAKADRQLGLLRYLIDRAAQPDATNTKEYIVGIEVFDRPSSFDPARDSIVRVEMRKLRKNLARYYETEGRFDVVVESIPKGSYAAVLEKPEPMVASTAEASPAARKPAVPRVFRMAAGLAAGLAVLLVGAWRIRSGSAPAPGIRAIAVLPFASIDHSAAEQSFADGLTAELINRMGQLPGIRVAGRGEVLRFRSGGPDAPRAAAELKVDGVVEGTVRISGKHARAGFELVEGNGGRVLLSKTFDLEIRDNVSAQTEIADAVLATVRFQEPSADERKLALRYQNSPAAREFYLHGLYGFDRGSRDGLEQSIADFQRAAEVDARYAPAYSAAADSFIALAIYGYWAPSDAIPKARDAANQALRLDPGLPEAYSALGFIDAVEADWTGAREQFEHAIRLNDGCAHCHAWYAFYVLGPAGLEAEALAQVEKAVELDPLDANFQAFGEAVSFFARDFPAAVRQGEKTVKDFPDSCLAHLYLGAALRRVGRYEDAVAESRKANELFNQNPIGLRYLALSDVSAGKRADAAAVLDQLEKRPRGSTSARPLWPTFTRR